MRKGRDDNRFFLPQRTQSFFHREHKEKSVILLVVSNTPGKSSVLSVNTLCVLCGKIVSSEAAYEKGNDFFTTENTKGFSQRALRNHEVTGPIV